MAGLSNMFISGYELEVGRAMHPGIAIDGADTPVLYIPVEAWQRVRENVTITQHHGRAIC